MGFGNDGSKKRCLQAETELAMRPERDTLGQASDTHN